MTDIQQLPAPAILAEDLRALADCVPFDEPTTRMLEHAALYLDRLDNFGLPTEAVFALREAATQARWNITHCEGVPEPSLEYARHWRATAVWLEKRAHAIEHGETPDRGYRPDEIPLLGKDQP